MTRLSRALALMPLFAVACSPPPRVVDAGAVPPAPSAPTTAAPTTAAPTTLSVDDAVRALIAAEVFEDERISYDGHLSDGVRAFRVVFSAPDAADRFRQIRARGTIVGQLYAAIGLRHHDPGAYAEAVKALRAHAGERVIGRFGCSEDGWLVGELLETKKSPPIRLATGQTFEEWMAIYKTGHTDIVGGSFTSSFGRVPSRL